MYGYEGIWSFDPSPWVVEAVPTAAMRTGDFSESARARIALPDLRSVLDPARRQRPFQPPAAAEQHHPREPDQPRRREDRRTYGTRRTRPGTVDGTNNYTKGKNAQDTYWNHIVRLDHYLSEKQRFYVRTNFTDLQRPENIRHNNAVGDNFFRYNKGFGFDDVYTFRRDLRERPLHADALHHRKRRRIRRISISPASGFSLDVRQPDQRGRSALLQAAEYQRQRLFEPGRRGVQRNSDGDGHP